jgi:acyl-CoA thioesterase I
VRLARGKGIAVVVLGVPKPGLSATSAAFYAEIAKEFAVPYEGAILKPVLTDNDLKSDWVHPNAKGYARIAAAVTDLLKKAKAIR